MTDLDMTWETTEDGARLIQLMGHRSDVLFDMDHMLYSSWLFFVAVALFMVFIAFVVFFCTDLFYKQKWNRARDAYDYEPRPHCQRNMVLAAVGIIAFGVLLCVVFYIIWGIHLDKELASTEAQIEAIRIRHPEWGI